MYIITYVIPRIYIKIAKTNEVGKENQTLPRFRTDLIDLVFSFVLIISLALAIFI